MPLEAEKDQPLRCDLQKSRCQTRDIRGTKVENEVATMPLGDYILLENQLF